MASYTPKYKCNPKQTYKTGLVKMKNFKVINIIYKKHGTEN